MSNDAVLVKAILEHHDAFEWSLQGLGMLRTHLSPEVRLHVWDSRFRVEGVTAMHTHPWNFHSDVVVGEVRNRRWAELMDRLPPCDYFQRQEISCKSGGHPEGDPQLVFLRPRKLEVYGTGESYSQEAYEIHESDPADGTVTIVTREFLSVPMSDRAFVYVPEGQTWVSAEHRPAKSGEVDAIVTRSLDRWFS